MKNGFINLPNGNLHLEIPVASYAQRGNLHVTGKLVYDSRIWQAFLNSPDDSPVWRPTNVSGTRNLGGGWRFVETGDPGRWDSNYTTKPCLTLNYGTGTVYYYATTHTNFVWTEADGTKHPLKNGIQPVKLIEYDSHCTTGTSTLTFHDTDGSGNVYKLSNYGVNANVLLSDGTQLTPTTQFTTEDANGNLLSFDVNQNVADTLNRTPILYSSNFAQNGNQAYIDYLNPQGARSRATVTTEYVPVYTNFGDPSIGECHNTPDCAVISVQSVQLGNLTSYTFTYDSYGELTGMTLPTGGQVSFTYANFVDVYGQTNRWVQSYTAGGGTWNFNTTIQSATAPYYHQTTITQPTRDDIVANITIGSQVVGPFMTQLQFFSGSSASGGTLLATENFDASACPGPIRDTFTWTSSNISKKVEYGYDGYNCNVAAIKEWDWVTGGSFGATPTRETDNTYVTDANYTLKNLVRLLSSTVVKDSSGNTAAQTAYAYDGTGLTASGIGTSHDPSYSTAYTTRGNLTSVSRWKNTDNSWLPTSFTYDDLGNRLSTTDPLNHTTNFTYSTGFASAYLTLVQNALQQKTLYDYDFNTGLRTSTTDPNNNKTSYGYDSMLRQVSTVFPPGGGQTTISFNGDAVPLTITSTSAIDSGKNLVKSTVYDGLGRASTTRLDSDPQGIIYVDTTYDSLGRVQTVSNPYRSKSESTYGLTTTAYDTFGRISQITKPDQNTTVNTYFERAVQTQDEGNGVRRLTKISQFDGLGNLRSVCEVTSATQMGSDGGATNCGLDLSGTGFLTSYDYDGLGNLKTVTQGGLTARSFSYDSLSQLLTAYNPESGLTSYTYDDDGNPKSRTRPAPNQSDATVKVTTTNQFDPLHRLTQTSYSDGVTPTVTRAYDETAIFGTSPRNPVGRLTHTVAAANNYVFSIFDYDNMGRVLTNWQGTPSNAGQSSEALGYTYDLLGNTLTSSNGAGVTFTNNYNAAGRLTSLTSSLADAAHPGTLLSNVVYGNSSYGPFGITSAAFGNGVTEQRAYSNRGWQQSLTAQGFVATPAVAGSVNMTLSGSERVGGAGTGSVTFSGTEQSTQVLNQAAAAGTGSFTVTGSEQSKQVLTTAATSGTGSITISGSERTTVVYYQCGQNSTCPTTVYDGGTVSITVNGLAKSTTYGSTSTAASIASALAGAFNTDSTSTVTVRASGGTVTFTANPTGAGTNYTLSATSATSNTANFTGTSFPAAASGATLTGGANAVYSTVYDSGTVTSTVNGFSVSASYGSGSTASSLATALASSFSVTSSPVTANASGGTVTVTAKVPGLVTNYSMSASATYNSSQFASPSFADSASGGALTGGRDATYDSGTASIIVNGHANSVSYGQGGNSTPAAIASALAAALTSDPNSPVNATANGSIVTITSRLAGAGTNYSLTKSVSTSQTQYFSQPSFSASASGSTLTGGIDTGGTVTYDTGNFSVTLNGYTKTTTYGQSSTPTTLASALATAFTNDAASPVSAVASAATITFTARATGYASNYSFSTATATTQTGFTPGSSSFSGPASGTLGGGVDSSTAPATVYSYSLGFDPNGDIASANDSVNGNWGYGYDDFNRLASASKPGQSFTYDYDRFGNRWHQNGTSQFMATFSSNNNRMDGYTYDLAGNVLTDNQNNQYTYDAESRVITGPGVSYKYDADGKRVEKLLSSGTKIDFLYDLSGREITELTNGGWSRGEVFAGGQHLATYNRGTTYFPLVDWLGTERAKTNLSGVVAEACVSLPFGDGQSCTGSDTGSSPNHFTGKERDSESGLDYFGARYYASGMGRFTSPDPLDASAHPANPQSWNRYAYTFNNPLRFVDVQGKCSSPAVGQGQVGVCIGLYISSRTINGLGLGDGRGPKANDPKATYRAEIHLVIDPAKGSVTMTKNDAGISKAIVPLPPVPFVIGNKGTSDTSVSKPTTDDNGTTHFNVSNTALNGLSFLNVGGVGAPTDSIKTSLNLDVTQDGKVGVEGGLRTAYPSLEIFSYDSSGNATPILQIQENKPDDLKKQDQVVPTLEPK